MRRFLLSVLLVGGLVAPAAAQAAFPGENGRIAFTSQPIGSPNIDIYTIDPAGFGPTPLTSDPEQDIEPAWSPDGKRIAYFGRLPGEAGIIVMNADGSGKAKITDTERSYTGGNPAWSPDGAWIAFDAFDGADTSDTEIYVRRSDGTGPSVQLTDNAAYDFYPAWSPDGSRIAFAEFVGPLPGPGAYPNYEIFVMDADGTDRLRLTFDSDQDTEPNWSPDGMKLVWNSSPTGIEVMNADGTDQHGFTPPVSGASPAWSPDGAKLVWSEGRDLHVMNTDGTGRGSFGNGSNSDRHPDWQPIPNAPPVCSSLSAVPSALRPANGRFHTVSLDGATDPDGDPVTILIGRVTQDERVGRRPDARRVAPGDKVELRAQRRPRGDGRVYRVFARAIDPRGQECSAMVSVEVRRKKNRPAVDSAPPSFDSFGS